ncbi:endolysin [Pseudomonas phage Amjad_SA]|nr:endolysin [Pseudomonas phage Amjad_SA]
MGIDNSYDQLRRDEGERLTAYQDHLGYWTIGVGILIDARKGGGLLPEESAFIFNNRLRLLERELELRLPWVKKLDPARRGVLVNMAYQMGIAGLLGFKNTLALIERGEYAKAASEMLGSKWAQQTPSRANRLSVQMRSGEWQ